MPNCVSTSFQTQISSGFDQFLYPEKLIEDFLDIYETLIRNPCSETHTGKYLGANAANRALTSDGNVQRNYPIVPMSNYLQDFNGLQKHTQLHTGVSPGIQMLPPISNLNLSYEQNHDANFFQGNIQGQVQTQFHQVLQLHDVVQKEQFQYCGSDGRFAYNGASGERGCTYQSHLSYVKPNTVPSINCTMGISPNNESSKYHSMNMLSQPKIEELNSKTGVEIGAGTTMNPFSSSTDFEYSRSRQSLLLCKSKQYCPLKDCSFYKKKFSKYSLLQCHCFRAHAPHGYLQEGVDPEQARGLSEILPQCPEPFCRRFFSRSDSLQRHIDRVHGSPNSRFNVRINQYYTNMSMTQTYTTEVSPKSKKKRTKNSESSATSVY